MDTTTFGVAVLAVGLAALLLQKKRKKTRRTRLERVTAPVLSYLSEVLEAFGDAYSQDNAGGSILLAVAENKLSWPLLKPRVQAALAKELPDFVPNYGPMQGREECRKVVASFLERNFTRSQQHLEGDDVALLTGVAACLSHVFFAICEAGDKVMVPSPSYAAFDFDLGALADLQCVPCDVKNLERSYTRDCTALLLTNPGNPTGAVLSAKDLADVAAFCERKDMHLVADEIYGLSTFRTHFTSLLTLPPSPRRHVVWGLSKDFGASGLRVGAVVSTNENVRKAMASLSNFSSVSGVVQHLLIDLLSDAAWCDSFTAQNNALLADACAFVERRLAFMNLPFQPPHAGMFLLVDLAEFLPAFSDSEDALYRRLCGDPYKLVLTPGHSMHCSRPGRFRICYAWVTPDVLREAMDRLARFVALHRDDDGGGDDGGDDDDVVA